MVAARALCAMEMAEPSAVEAVGERMSMRCPITQQRIRQAVRLSGCSHGQAFDAEALPVIFSDGVYRCPLCGGDSTSYDIDVPLTLFVTENPDAESAAVRRSGAAWSYARPRGAERPRTRRRHSKPAARVEPVAPPVVDAPDPTSWQLDDGARRRIVAAHSGTRLPPSAKAIARSSRREASQRTKLLVATREQLIRRALHEDASSGDHLFAVDGTRGRER